MLSLCRGRMGGAGGRAAGGALQMQHVLKIKVLLCSKDPFLAGAVGVFDEP